MWEEVTTLFSRGRDGGEEATPPPLAGVEAPDGVVHWKLPGDLGRRYGAVSGDRNPIHLYPLTAKAFGFPRNIAHGMWTKARALAALQNKLPDAFTIDVEFRKPILLPSTVVFGSRTDGGVITLGVTGARKPSTHLVGRISPTRKCLNPRNAWCNFSLHLAGGTSMPARSTLARLIGAALVLTASRWSVPRLSLRDRLLPPASRRPRPADGPRARRTTRTR